MKTTHPNEIYPSHQVYTPSLPDHHKPRILTFGLWGWLLRLAGVDLAYIVTPRKFDSSGRCTHESRRLEAITKNGTLLFSCWE